MRNIDHPIKIRIGLQGEKKKKKEERKNIENPIKKKIGLKGKKKKKRKKEKKKEKRSKLHNVT